ncbi:MAG: hypothetical protein WCO84_00160 [bacterium]
MKPNKIKNNPKQRVADESGQEKTDRELLTDKLGLPKDVDFKIIKKAIEILNEKDSLPTRALTVGVPENSPAEVVVTAELLLKKRNRDEDRRYLLTKIFDIPDNMPDDFYKNPIFNQSLINLANKFGLPIDCSLEDILNAKRLKDKK